MKKKIITICIGCLLLFANSLLAKSERGRVKSTDYESQGAEWYLGYGFPNIPANVLPSQSSTLGPISLGYRHSINERLSWGLSLSYARTETKNDYIYGAHVQSNVTFFTVMADLNYKWYSKNDNYLFSGAGAGYCLTGVGISKPFSLSSSYTDKYEPKPTVAYQVNIIGFNYLIGKRLAVFIQAGYGYTGIVSGGLCLR